MLSTLLCYKMSTSFLVFLAWTVIFMTDLGPIGAKDECFSNADCYSDFRHLRIVCCKNSHDSDRICQPYNCEGRYCFTHGDCGGEGECCINNKCNHSENCPKCNTSSDCTHSEICCKRPHGNVCRRNCVGVRCTETSDCAGFWEYCDSSNVCAKLARSTKIPTQYRPGNTKVNQILEQNTANQKLTASASSEAFPGWGIGFIIIGLIIAAIVGYLFYDRCSKRQARQNTSQMANNNTSTRSLPVTPTASRRPSERRSLSMIPTPTQQSSEGRSPPVTSTSTHRSSRRTTTRPAPPVPTYDATATRNENISETAFRQPPPPPHPAAPEAAYAEARFVMTNDATGSTRRSEYI